MFTMLVSHFQKWEHSPFYRKFETHFKLVFQIENYGWTVPFLVSIPPGSIFFSFLPNFSTFFCIFSLVPPMPFYGWTIPFLLSASSPVLPRCRSPYFACANAGAALPQIFFALLVWTPVLPRRRSLWASFTQAWISSCKANWPRSQSPWASDFALWRFTQAWISSCKAN